MIAGMLRIRRFLGIGLMRLTVVRLSRWLSVSVLLLRLVRLSVWLDVNRVILFVSVRRLNVLCVMWRWWVLIWILCVGRRDSRLRFCRFVRSRTVLVLWLVVVGGACRRLVGLDVRVVGLCALLMCRAMWLRLWTLC